MTDLERKVFRLSAIVGSALTLVVLGFDAMGWLGGLENWLYDRRVADCQYFRKPPSDRIVHLDIDDRSLEAIGHWPWPRDRFAAILEEIGRAKPKVVGTDIVYSEPVDPRLEKTPDNSFVEVNEDRAMADALQHLGCVVLPASLKLAPTKSVTALETAIVAELTANLEITPEELDAKLRLRGFAPKDVTQTIADQFFPARRQAMYDRILQEIGDQNLTVVQLFPRLLPHTDPSVNSPLQRVVEEQFQRVLEWKELQRFTFAPQPNAPAPLATIPYELPISLYSHVARSCGFADDSLSEPVVRSEPMFVLCDHRIFAQWGLAFACVLADADLNKARLSDQSVTIPSATGDLVIPLHWQYSSGAERNIPFIATIPWFGNSNWQTMYDWPKHEQVINHIPINVVWDICETVAHIKKNNAAIDSAVRDLLDNPSEELKQLRLGLDPSVAKKYNAAIPPMDQPLSRQPIIETTEKIIKDSGLIESFAAIKPQDLKPDERATLDLLTDARKYMHAAFDQNQQLAAQLISAREDLARKIGNKGVLIGSTATGAMDMVTTPLHARCPGVVVHGAIANALLTHQWWYTAPFWVTALLTLILGIFISLATGWLSPPAGVVTAIGVAILYFLANGILMFDWGHWIVGAAGPMVVIALTWAGCIVTRIITEGIDRIHRERDLAVFRHEMSLAKNVQVALIPKEMPVIDGIEPFGWTKPADETGGDLFDLWTLPDGRLGILVADASGHGLAPSVIVSQVRTLVRALSEIETHPNGLLARVNARLSQDLEPARFVTAFLGFLDSVGTLHWASAGHGPMLWCAKDGEEYLSLDATALPLGIMPDFMGDEIGPLQLDIGGMLIVTSDGIFEAPDPTGDQFGIERVVETLQKTRGASAVEIIAAIRDSVTKWQAKDRPVDDQTTVIIRRVAAGVSVTIVEDKAEGVAASTLPDATIQ